MARLKLATVWLGGCSGCHMSFLDMDDWLVDLAGLADVVYSLLVDAKEYPAGVDVCLVEGAVANEDNDRMIRTVRARTRVVVAFGDCAVTGNVTALRNPLGGPDLVIGRSYLTPADEGPKLPYSLGVVPPLLDRVRPVHHVVPVDAYLPGCPPPAAHIRAAVEALVAGRPGDIRGEMIRFG